MEPKIVLARPVELDQFIENSGGKYNAKSKQVRHLVDLGISMVENPVYPEAVINDPRRPARIDNIDALRQYMLTR